MKKITILLETSENLKHFNFPFHSKITIDQIFIVYMQKNNVNIKSNN